VGGGGAAEPEQTVELTIRGEALSELTQGRVSAQGGSWYPVRLLGAVAPTPRVPRSLQVINKTRRSTNNAPPPLFTVWIKLSRSAINQQCLPSLSSHNILNCWKNPPPHSPSPLPHLSTRALLVPS